MRGLPALVAVVTALLLTAASQATAQTVSYGESAPLARALAHALVVPHVARSRSAALAVDLATGATVFAQNAGVALAPASNEKLPVTYAALARLGASYEIDTEVLGVGELEGDTWRGTLVLKGFGDPTLSTFDLTLLARQIRAIGIAHVIGGIRGDESFFDTERTAPGWLPSFYINESPPLSALVVDRGRFRGYVTPTPALAAAISFKDALRRAGVVVAGRSTTGPTDPDAAVLADVESPPLATIIRFMDHESDNFTAEMLLKQLAALDDGRGTTGGGSRAVRDVLAQDGIPLNGVRIVDGSGLSRLDRLTARTLVALLRRAWNDVELGSAFYAALPVAGRSGTLSDRLRGTRAAGRVVAKTGTTAVASALSGFVGRRYAFAILQNGSPISTWWARRAQDRFVSVLAAQ